MINPMKVSETKQKTGTVFVSGLFNILHPGHFRFLKFAREQGEKLIVGVLSDRQAPEVSINQHERLANIATISFIDEVFILDSPPQDFVSRTKPDVVVKGWEHRDKNNPEKDVLDTYGGELIFSSGDIKLSGFKSSWEDENLSSHTIIKPQGFMQRHGFSSQKLKDIVKRFSNLNVCVLGDIIVDNYVNCQPVGMSREDPTIVVRPAESNFFLGGAGIVAAHARGLGANVHFISVSGLDEAGAYSRKKLDEAEVNYHIFEDRSRPTTQKKRYRASGKTLLRVNDYAVHPISSEIADKIKKQLKDLKGEIDVIIFSDFSYGALPQELVEDIIGWAENKKIIVAADSQSSSQIGDISRFRNLELITPTEHEARLALNNFTDGLVQLSDRMQELTGAKNVIITLAEEGLFVSKSPSGSNASQKTDIINDRLPALQASARDVAGAGDALLVATSLALATQASIWEASYIGSLASAVQVSRVGNIPLKNKELLKVLST